MLNESALEFAISFLFLNNIALTGSCISKIAEIARFCPRLLPLEGMLKENK